MDQSLKQEWTPEYLHSIGIFTTEQMCDAHNAAIAAERQRLKRAQDFSYLCHQQLLSALAAIEKHNTRFATDPRLASKRIDVDLSSLHEHNAEVREPLVDALELVRSKLYKVTYSADLYALEKIIDDAKEK